MGRKSRPIEAKHITKLSDYFGKKYAARELDNMVEGSPSEAHKALSDVIDAQSAEVWNEWADTYLSAEGRRLMWGALRGRKYRKENPRNELTKTVADQLRNVTQMDDINEAVLSLLNSR